MSWPAASSSPSPSSSSSSATLHELRASGSPYACDDSFQLWHSIAENEKQSLMCHSDHTTTVSDVAAASGSEQAIKAKNTRLLLLTIAALLLTWLVLILPAVALSAVHDKVGLHCGQTVAEAVSRGCEFDMLSYSWTPTECFDQQTAEEFLDWTKEADRIRGPFPFFIDRDGHQKIADERELATYAGGRVYATQEEHLGHCIFHSIRAKRVQLGLARAVSFGTSLDHTRHCGNEMLKALSPSNITRSPLPHAHLYVGFNRC